MLVRLHTITFHIHHLHSDFFLGAALPTPWQRKDIFFLLSASSPKSTNQNPLISLLHECKFVSLSWRKAAERPFYSECHISHINALWSIKQLIHTVCLCRPQRNSWASGIITCTLLPSCPQHMVQGTDTKSREGQPKDSRALETNLEICFIEQGESGHVQCSLTSNINNPVTGRWYLWLFRRRARRMTPPGRKLQAFKRVDTCHEVPSKEIPLQEPIRNLCLSLGKRKQLGRLRKVKKVLRSFLLSL